MFKYYNLDANLGGIILEKLTAIQNSITIYQKPFLDIDQAAEYLNLSKFTLYNFTSQNILPFHKAGRKIYFAKSDLDEFALNKKTRRKSKEEIDNEATARILRRK